MIIFKARMYNVTGEYFLDESPRDYSIGHYTGDEIGIGDDGTVRTDIPLSHFNYSQGTNIGTAFEASAKAYYYLNQVWPVLRLFTSNEMDDYYLEWTHADPTGFNVKSPSKYSRWPLVYQWDDYIDPGDPSQGIMPRYNTVYSNVFVSVGTVDELNTQAIIWSGAVSANISQDVETLISYATALISVLDQRCYISTAGTYLGKNYGRWGRREYYKLYDGPAIYVWCYNPPGPETDDWKGPAAIAPVVNGNVRNPLAPFNPWFTYNTGNGTQGTFEYKGLTWGFYHNNQNQRATEWNTPLLMFQTPAVRPIASETWCSILDQLGVEVTLSKLEVYYYLQGSFDPPEPEEPDTDVDPEDIPPEDDPPKPINPDLPDPYYDPTSDPTNPQYDPTKDPNSPQYDPTDPHTPYRPPSQPSDPPTQEKLPPKDPIPTPVTPPSYVTTNAMFTLYNPSGGDLTNLAGFLWSPTWSIDTFKKIFANPLDCILGLMVMPHLNAPVDSKVMNVGNISTGVTMHYFTQQFYDFNCGTFELMEYYNSYLDYAPYTKVNIYLPYIGDKQLSTDEVMNKTLGVKYRFDLATGDCIAFITVDGTVLYSFSGNCAARLPLAGNNWNGIIPAITGVAISAGSMAAGLPALGAASAAAVSTMKETISHTGSVSGSPGLMGIQKPYLIVNRPRQALPIGQNSFTGYPSFITESLGSLTGYTEVEQCHLEHVPATGAELEEIERLLKEGVLF